MKNVNIDSLMKMLQNMDQKELESSLAKAQEILNNKNKQ